MTTNNDLSATHSHTHAQYVCMHVHNVLKCMRRNLFTLCAARNARQPYSFAMIELCLMLIRHTRTHTHMDTGTGSGTDIDRCAHAHKTNSCNESNLYRRRRCFCTIHSLSLSVCSLFFHLFQLCVCVCRLQLRLLIAGGCMISAIYALIFWINLLHDMNWSFIYHDAQVAVIFGHIKSSQQLMMVMMTMKCFSFRSAAFFHCVMVCSHNFLFSIDGAPQFVS